MKQFLHSVSLFMIFWFHFKTFILLLIHIVHTWYNKKCRHTWTKYISAVWVYKWSLKHPVLLLWLQIIVFPNPKVIFTSTLHNRTSSSAVCSKGFKSTWFYQLIHLKKKQKIFISFKLFQFTEKKESISVNFWEINITMIQKTWTAKNNQNN